MSYILDPQALELSDTLVTRISFIGESFTFNVR
jgi:hypothetical protein